MKSRITTVTDNEIVLSIGMIVKNEEKVLRRCLESLKPLMSAVNCELIIADTGSTDSSFEIAKEYTDIVYHFEWINDFGAARNSTLDRAHGIWYMFIDADEYFDDDVTEMIKFFSYPDLYKKKYNSLQIYIRNYHDTKQLEYSDVRLPRFFRRKEETIFVGKIHETILFEQPSGFFSTIIHHTGYVYETEESAKKKKNRNLPYIKEEYEKNPEDYRTLCHIIDSSSFEPENQKKYYQNAFNLLKNNNDNMYANVLYMQIADGSRENPYFALEVCDEYFTKRENADNYIVALPLHVVKGDMLYAIFNKDEAFDEYKKYLKLFSEYKEGKLDESDLVTHPVFALTDREYIRFILYSSQNAISSKFYGYANEALKSISFEKIPDDYFFEFTNTVKTLCFDSKEYDFIISLYSYVVDNDSKYDKLKYVTKTVEVLYSNIKTDDEKELFRNKLISSGISSYFIDVLKYEFNYEIFPLNDFIEYIETINDWTLGCSRIIYLCLKYNIDLCNYIDKMKVSDYCDHISFISQTYNDYIDIVLNYGMPDKCAESVKRFYWLVDLYGEAVYRSEKIEFEKKIELYTRFIQLLSDYVMNIYSLELLNDDDIEVLPNIHRFGYYIYKANCALENGDSIGYIRGLKNALIHCESMKDVVEVLTKKFRMESGV